MTRSTMATALGASGLDVVCQASSASAAIAGFEAMGADVALIDLDLGGGPTGLDLAVALRERDPGVGLILLTSYDDPRLLDQGLPALPTGGRYLRKRQVSSVGDIREAIDQVLRNPSASAAESDRRSHDLTDAQFSLLRDVARGMTNAQIAQARGVSLSAVEKAIRRLLASLGVSEAQGNPRALLIGAYLRMSGRDVRSGA